MIPLYTVMVRRDAHTKTPIDVPAHEIPILQAIFGEESILNASDRLISDGLGEPVGGFTVGEDEHARLASRYGGNDKGPFVEQVYGLKASGNLARAMADAAKPAKATKPAKE